MGDEDVRQVGRGQVVESFESQEEYVVFTRPGVTEEASTRVLDHLESMEGMRGDASEEGVAVIKTGRDEGVDEGFSSRGGLAVSDFGDAAEVEVGGLNNGADVGNKGESGVHDNTASTSHSNIIIHCMSAVIQTRVPSIMSTTCDSRTL